MATIRQVNKALKANGIDGELVHGKGYYYFSGNSFDRCRETAIYTYRLSVLTIEQVLNEAKRMIENSNKGEFDSECFAIFS